MPGITLIFDAIERYYTLMLADDPAERRAFVRLHRWFECEERTHPEAFEHLCRQYGIDPDAIRHMLRRRRNAAVRSS